MKPRSVQAIGLSLRCTMAYANSQFRQYSPMYCQTVRQTDNERKTDSKDTDTHTHTITCRHSNSSMPTRVQTPFHVNTEITYYNSSNKMNVVVEIHITKRLKNNRICFKRSHTDTETVCSVPICKIDNY